MSTILALGRLKQENGKFKAGLDPSGLQSETLSQKTKQVGRMAQAVKKGCLASMRP
jgi:hypothetical protein